jgi:hypothetical protein
MRLIPTEHLRLSDIPLPSASIREMIAFAHTFNGYKACGSFEKCAEIANSKNHSSTIFERACFFRFVFGVTRESTQIQTHRRTGDFC